MEKFEVGDKVKVVRLDTTWRYYVDIGATGKVKYFSDKNQLVEVVFADGSSGIFDPNWLKIVEKKKKGWTGKVVCTSIVGPCFRFFTPGKVYDVKDGLLIDNTGTPYISIRFNSANELVDYFETQLIFYRFIEFKGFNEK